MVRDNLPEIFFEDEEPDDSAVTAGPSTGLGGLISQMFCDLTGESTWPAKDRAVEAIIDYLLAGKQKEYSKAFQLLVSIQGGQGGLVGMIGPTVFRGRTFNPQIIFSHGDYQKTSDNQELIKFFYDCWSERRTALHRRTIISGESHLYFLCCAIPFSDDEVVGIVIWGAAPDHFNNSTLLYIFARLLTNALMAQTAATGFAHRESYETRNVPEGYIKGHSDVMNALHHEIEMLSQVDFPVLLLGETGVGKEYLARLLHQWSPRRNSPFVAVNCAAIPNELLEAEMFGIGRGVASGVLEREGYFQIANGGTLLLDEVGELQLSLQAKLLRVLQDKEVRRVGGSTIRPDVRIVAATNADLRRRMDEGTFRPDLYYRLAGFEVLVPPLRERKGDLPLFIEHYLRKFSKEARKTIKGMTLKTLELLNEYPWPGNIREFAHEMRRLVYLCPNGQAINSSLLPAHVRALGVETCNEAEHGSADFSLEVAYEKLERRLIGEALRKTRGNRTQAAKLLGITRNGLAIKMDRLGIKI